ncbi:glycoside hydrolase family 2 protein, partial [Streptomyces sp. SID7499]|nr:glycoside hydrolase family 2 protein [Streptomyces sp. SID7499]
RTDLVFDGLDTAARIVLDGREVGTTRNMHRTYRFDVTGLAGMLEVRFASAYAEAEAVRAITGDRPNVYPEPFQYIRKMASGFGWDWGPTLVTAGIWRPVRLEHWSTARLASVRPLVTVDESTGNVEVRLRVERTAGGENVSLLARATVAGETAEARFEGDEAVLRLTVDRPRLWWPRGYGDQPLYDLDVTLSGEDGQLDAWHRRIGFRTVELDRTADARGSGFTLVVNGERVFAR